VLIGTQVKAKVKVSSLLNRPRRPRGGVDVVYFFFYLVARWEWVVNATFRSLCSVKDPVPIVQEAGWAPEPVWTGAENLAPHRDSIPGPSSPYRIAIRTELSNIYHRFVAGLLT
jgi:hypothetical protein